MVTIVERIRNTIAIENDNFYDNTVLLDYANLTKESVLSFLLLKEDNIDKLIQALDDLRVVEEVELTTTPTKISDYFRYRVNKPNDIRKILFIRKDNIVPVRELTPKKLFQVSSGNIVPLPSENYYSIVGNLLEIYTDSDEDSDLEVYFIKDPESLVLNSTDLIDLPNRLINAVVYGSVHLALLQEGFEMEGDISTANKYQEKFDRELQVNGY